MEKYNILNLNEYSWQLNVAIMGFIFSVFSLIYDTYYIYYGLVTFIYGVSGHVIYTLIGWVPQINKGTGNFWGWFYYFYIFSSSFIWIFVLFNLY